VGLDLSVGCRVCLRDHAGELSRAFPRGDTAGAQPTFRIVGASKNPCVWLGREGSPREWGPNGTAVLKYCRPCGILPHVIGRPEGAAAVQH
jgi:hypothetical protein